MEQLVAGLEVKLVKPSQPQGEKEVHPVLQLLYKGLAKLLRVCV